MSKALRGLNLGGWLVAERWMTPGLFDGVRGDGEVSIVRELGREEAARRLTYHRDSFITEADFQWIAAQGFEYVRLPIGYWTHEDHEDFISGERYVACAFDWAERHGLKILLDFHGLQGSQNGQDHSGVPGRVRMHWVGNHRRALSTLEVLCRTYGQHSALLGLEVINEPKLPWVFGWWRLLRYYDRAVALAERYLPPEAKIIVSDAFQPLRMAEKLAGRGYDQRVVLDIHLYQVFGRHDQMLDYDEHVAIVRNEWQGLISRASERMPVLVGEWSAALPAIAETDDFNLQYFKAQQAVFDSRAWAQCYWSYKAPGAGAWDYRSRTSYHQSVQ